MKIDRRITGGLAWTGLAVILAVPSADILFGKPDVHAAITSDMTPVRADAASPAPSAAPATVADSAQAAPVTTGKPAATTPVTDPVQTASVSSGTTAAPGSATTPAATQTAPVQVASAPQQSTLPALPAASTDGSAETVATTQPQEVPPIPMPRNMRPAPAPVAVANVAPQQDQPVILDESQVRRDQASNNVSPDFFGPQSDGSGGRVIGQDKLEAWNSGSLEEYLKRNNLLDEGSAQGSQIDDSYDPNGFYLSDGPNRPRRYQRDNRNWNQDQNWYF